MAANRHSVVWLGTHADAKACQLLVRRVCTYCRSPNLGVPPQAELVAITSGMSTSTSLPTGVALRSHQAAKHVGEIDKVVAQTRSRGNQNQACAGLVRAASRQSV